MIGTNRYTYDENGNPLMREDTVNNAFRQMLWDEENRLAMLSDDGYTSRYTYNHGGERVIKSHGGTTGVYIDGNPQGILYHDADNYTAYVSPYMVVSKDRFTKHYYTGTQRVASKIGVGKFNNLYIQNGSNITAGQKDYAARMTLIEQDRADYYAQLGIPPGPPTSKGIFGEPEYAGKALPNDVLGNYDIPANWPRPPVKNKPGDVPGPPVMYAPPVNPQAVEPGYGYTLPVPLTEDDIYFYHSDHLGSTSYVTDTDANPTQFVCYMPFGEAFVDEHTTRAEMPFKFNGKEQDSETGLYYYGARYYDPMIAVWYGVDPLAEKMPSWSSYAYTFNNPINFIDPDGRRGVRPSRPPLRRGAQMPNNQMQTSGGYRTMERYNPISRNNKINVNYFESSNIPGGSSFTDPVFSRGNIKGQNFNSFDEGFNLFIKEKVTKICIETINKKQLNGEYRESKMYVFDFISQDDRLKYESAQQNYENEFNTRLDEMNKKLESNFEITPYSENWKGLMEGANRLFLRQEMGPSPEQFLIEEFEKNKNSQYEMEYQKIEQLPIIY